MSQQLNGSETRARTHVFRMDDASSVGEARRYVQSLSAAAMLDNTQSGRLGIIVNELGNNLVRYAKNGRLLIRLLGWREQVGVEILSIDSGPGFYESLAMKDGYSSGRTPGTGLGAIKRQSDEFDLYSWPGCGTAIMSRVYGEGYDHSRSDYYEMGAINIPYKDEKVSGDCWAFMQDGFEAGVMMVDGLGHGPLARQAAAEAVDAFEQSYPLQPAQMLQVLHGRLKSTRGGAVFILSASMNELEYVGAGNIRAMIYQTARVKNLVSQNGTIGVQIRSTPAFSEPWDGKGYIVFHSDGIKNSWDLRQYHGLFSRHPALLAAMIFRDGERGSDDACVLVTRRRS